VISAVDVNSGAVIMIMTTQVLMGIMLKVPGKLLFYCSVMQSFADMLCKSYSFVSKIELCYIVKYILQYVYFVTSYLSESDRRYE